jgi:hemerythrin
MGEGIIEWKKEHEMGVPLLDGQHRHLLEMTNWLNEQCPQNKESIDAYKDAALNVFDDLRRHFYTEEILMILTNYDSFATHKTAHRACVDIVLESIADLVRFSPSVTAEMLIRALREALFADLMDHDRKLTDYIALLKQQGKLEAALRNMPQGM